MARTIPELFLEQAHRFARKPLFWVKREGVYRSIDWASAKADVDALSAYLLRLKVQPGERVLLLSENRPEWGIADLAIQSIGAWTVPIYPTLTPHEILVIARDCEPVVAIASTDAQRQKLQALCSQLPSLQIVVVMDAAGNLQSGEQAWAVALREGREAGVELQPSLQARRSKLRPEATMTLIYTSGTTGDPKGVMLSHSNFLSNAEAGLRALSVSAQDLHLSFLPLSHVFERMAGWYLMLMAGASVAYAENMDTIPDNMREVRPTIMLGVPRFFEKLYARVHAGLEQLPTPRRRMAAWALDIGRRTSAARCRGRPIPLSLTLAWWLANLLVLRKLQRRLGGRLRFFVSGSAALSKSIAEFFFAAGITILEGYGLTETSPVITVNRLRNLTFGTVGLPLDAVKVRIAEDGEILTSGPHVMQGYYRKPEDTRAVLTDGWLCTGDIGRLDGEGFLSITDRKKDLIKTAGGKFVAPQKLERLFAADPLVAQVFVHGEGERYCVALIVPNFERAQALGRERGWPCATPQETARSPELHAMLWQRIQDLQRELPSFEQVKAIALLDQEFAQASGELTPTLKARRGVIATRYQDILRRLYHASAAQEG